MNMMYGENYVNNYIKGEGEGRLERLIDLINFYKNDSCLDFGCGNGFWYPLIKDKIAKYVGIDSSKEFIKAAKDDLKNKEADFHLINKTKNWNKDFNFKFSKIFLLDVTEHIEDEELIKVLKNCNSVLQENGKIFIHTPNLTYLVEIFKKYGILEQYEGHIAVRSAKQYQKLFQKLGFNNYKITYLPHYENILAKLDFLKYFPLIGKFFKARLFIEITKESINKKKDILYIARNYPPSIGGLERMNFELVKYLNKYYQVKLIANKRHRFSIIFLTMAFGKAILAKEKIIFLSDGLLAIYIPFFKLIGKKVIIKVHGLDLLKRGLFYQAIIPSCLKRADQIVAISKAVKDVCLNLNISQKKIKIIPVGIDRDRFKKKPKINKDKLLKELDIKTNSKIILSVGRLVKRKGMLWFIKNVLKNLDDNYFYIIIGSGKYYQRIDRYIQHHNLNKKVKLMGEISDEKLRQIFHLADIFVIPNIKVENNMEGFGIVALEAACYGLAVIASKIDGIVGAINSNNGFLVESENTMAFIQAIKSYFKLNEKTKDKLRVQFKKYSIEKYDWHKIILEYKKLIDQLL